MGQTIAVCGLPGSARTECGTLLPWFVMSLLTDRFVLGNFGLHLLHWGADERESKSIVVFEQLWRKYEDVMTSATGRMIWDQFQARYPWAPVSYLKMLDLLFWQICPEQQ
jgi:hypothetical protein